jgi:hypothetical protein
MKSLSLSSRSSLNCYLTAITCTLLIRLSQNYQLWIDPLHIGWTSCQSSRESVAFPKLWAAPSLVSTRNPFEALNMGSFNVPATTVEVDGTIDNDIAICGFSLKFPQDATSAESFWRMMMDRHCASTDFPPDRINANGFYRSENTSNTVSKYRTSGKVTVINTSHSFHCGVVTSLRRTSQSLMLISSVYHRLKQQQWTLCKDGYWRQHTMHLKMVSCNGLQSRKVQGKTKFMNNSWDNYAEHIKFSHGRVHWIIWLRLHVTVGAGSREHAYIHSPRIWSEHVGQQNKLVLQSSWPQHRTRFCLLEHGHGHRHSMPVSEKRFLRDGRFSSNC